MDYEDVDSSMIAAVGYDPEQRQLGVKFKKGTGCTYHDVPPEAHAELMSAESIGKHLHAHILGTYRHTIG